MANRPSHSALLSKYLDQYRRKPGSRVFAPLAEAYRKLGMTDEALKVLKEGIRRHPGYALGYLVLAQCYADQLQWDRAYQTLLPLTPTTKDNVQLQKLFAQACLETGEMEAALDTYKWLLFLNPRDKEFAKHVVDLEDELLSTKRTVPKEALVKAPGMPAKKPDFDADEDDWTMVSFDSQAPEMADDSEDNWTMTSTPLPEAPPPKASTPDEWQVMSRKLDDDFFSDEEVTPEYAEAPVVEGDQLLVSHTLVDLYVAQNHFAPAIELLEKFLEVNPQDDRSRRRLFELRGKLNDSELTHTEADGHAELLRLVQTKVHSPKHQRIEEVWGKFLSQIQRAAMRHQAQHV